MFARLLVSACVSAILYVGSNGSASAIDIQEVTSPSGITAWLVSDNTVPLVSLDFAFKGAGAAQDPDGKAGRANLLSAMLDEGAADMDSVAFQTALRDNAVQLGFDASRDHFYGDMRVVSAALDRGVDLLALALTVPRFEDEALTRMRNQALVGIRRSLNDPDTVVTRLWERTAFPHHPYGTPANGTVETVASLTRDDLVAAWRDGFAKDNLRIAVVGDITAERLAPLLDKAFGDLPATSRIAPVPPVEPAVGLTVSETVETPQTAIRFGGPGLMRDDPDFMPAFVMNHILGGGTFSSWLFSEVREKRGLAYSVYSYIAPYQHTAVFGGGTATRNDRANEAVEVILAQIEKMATEGPTQAQLDDAKAYLVGNYALRFGSSGGIARQLLWNQLEDLGVDYFDKRNAMIEAVSLEDVRRAARRILGEGKPTVAIVGAAAG